MAYKTRGPVLSQEWDTKMPVDTPLSRHWTATPQRHVTDHRRAKVTGSDCHRTTESPPPPPGEHVHCVCTCAACARAPRAPFGVRRGRPENYKRPQSP